MKKYLCCAGAVMLAACQPVSEVEKGPPFAIEAGRLGGNVRVTLRYADGAPIPASDLERARARGVQVGCVEGETAIADTAEITDGVVTARHFCVKVTNSEAVIDGTRFQ